MNMYKNTQKLALASAICLALAASTGSMAAQEPSGDITEARQESQILTTYALSRHLDAHDLKVTVDDGVATLAGKVSEEAGKELAEQIALSVTGINDVNNQIEVDGDYIPTKASGDRSYGEVIEDASITAAVKSKLLWSKHAQGLSANVQTMSREVTLHGTANSAAAKEMAGLLASNTHGVKTVHNKLIVDEAKSTTMESAKDNASDLGQSISDTWITTKVKSTLMYSSNVNGSNIAVTTKNGAVTLSGKVTSDLEHDLAVELAKNVRGVSSVDAKNLTR